MHGSNRWFAYMSRPTLGLGLVGFDAADARRIESQLKLAPVGGVKWRIDDFPKADAWLVDGGRTHVVAFDEVSVDSPSPGCAPVRFWLPEVDRPIAFSRPLASRGFEPACTFDPASSSGLVVVLAKFSQWLRPRAMLLALADLLTQHAARIRHRGRVFHLVSDNRLVAVVDLQGDVGVLADATLGDLSRASWLPRPDAAAYVPRDFARRPIRELLWDYAGRTPRELLPPRYREVPIHLKRTPVLEQRMLGDAQLFVLRELSEAPRTFAQLCAAAHFSAHDIARALLAHYLVGCITTSPGRSFGTRHESDTSQWPWGTSQHGQSQPGELSAAH